LQGPAVAFAECVVQIEVELAADDGLLGFGQAFIRDGGEDEAQQLLAGGVALFHQELGQLATACFGLCVVARKAGQVARAQRLEHHLVGPRWRLMERGFKAVGDGSMQCGDGVGGDRLPRTLQLLPDGRAQAGVGKVELLKLAAGHHVGAEEAAECGEAQRVPGDRRPAGKEHGGSGRQQDLQILLAPAVARESEESGEGAGHQWHG
jgi:hypothetical protein